MDEAVPLRKNSSGLFGKKTGRKPDDQKHHDKSNKGKLKLIAISVGTVLLFAGLSLAVLLMYRSNTNSSIDNGKYQAVFLSNGQVYFGKLHTYNNEYMKLSNIYYLQTKTTTETSSNNPQSTSSQNDANVQLIKLGSEIHGPDDEMVISKDQILFFENLKKESQVTKSIEKYNKPS